VVIRRLFEAKTLELRMVAKPLYVEVVPEPWPAVKSRTNWSPVLVSGRLAVAFCAVPCR
jgi:hypothetical protein